MDDDQNLEIRPLTLFCSIQIIYYKDLYVEKMIVSVACEFENRLTLKWSFLILTTFGLDR